MGLRIVDLLLVLPELSWRWLVFLGPRSLDQRRGLLCPIAAFKPQDHGPGPPIIRPRVSDHGPLVLALNSFGDRFCLDAISTHAPISS